jgi:hypothetical protein
MSDGGTIEEAITNCVDAMRGWIEAMQAEASDPRTDALRGGLSAGDRGSSVSLWQGSILGERTSGP